jgi:peptidoglycan hydrolase FlgJ
MLRPELTIGATPSLAGTPALQANTRPTAALASAGVGFGALFGDVRGDVEDFIENGSHGAGASAMPPSMGSLSVEGQAVRDASAAASAGSADAGVTGQAQQEFLAAIAPLAQQTGQQLGVSPDIVAAQAALETGWGQKPLRQADGADTHNLFGMKAGSGWRGDVTSAMTTEDQDGTAIKKTERFRSYPDQASAFHDYAQLLLTNPRYRSALNAGSDAQAFAQGLARGGYATDPAYADKLTRIAARVRSQSGE